MNHYNPDTFDGEDVATFPHFHPIIGPYDPRDPDVCEYHALLMKWPGSTAPSWIGMDSRASTIIR